MKFDPVPPKCAKPDLVYIKKMLPLLEKKLLTRKKLEKNFEFKS